MRREFRDALRSLKRTPGFTALTICMLGLGIGACTVVFILINAIHFRALPFPQADQLAVVELIDERGICKGSCRARMELRTLREWSEALDAIDDIAFLGSFPAVLSDPAGTALGSGAAVSSNFFSLLGVKTSLGRIFDSEDDRVGADDVAILSDAFWRESFGADSLVLGKLLTLNGIPYEIVGILPPTAAIGRPLFVSDTLTAQYFVPLGPYVARRRDRAQSYSLLVRRNPEVSLAVLRAQTAALLASSRSVSGTNDPPSDTPLLTGTVISVHDAHVQGVAGPPYLIFLGAVGFVFLIVCVNLSGLFLARCRRRSHESSIRAALGASPRRLAMHLGAEVLLCALAGCALALVLSSWALSFFRMLPRNGIPYWTDFTIDGRMFAFACCLIGASTLIVVVWPAAALFAGRAGESIGLAKPFYRSSSRIPYGGSLMLSLQVALALLLLTGAGLFGKMFLGANNRDIGMVRESVLMGGLQGRSPPATQGQLGTRQFEDLLLERLKRLRGAVGATIHLTDRSFPGLMREDDGTPLGVNPSVSAHAVSPDYFSVWGIRLISGRLFDDGDNETAPPVVILGEKTAERLFPLGNAVGRRIRLGLESSAEPWMTIVGIVGETRTLFPMEEERFYPTLYRPLAQSGVPGSGIRFDVRAAGSPMLLAPAVRASIRELSPGTALSMLTSNETELREALAPLRLSATVLAGFAAVATLILGMGVYGVVAQSVTQRLPEIALRMALGAQRGSVIWPIVRSSLAATLVGVLGGAAGALALTRLVRAQVYHANTADPLVFIGSALIVLGAALAAAYRPARHATHISPSAILRGT